MAARCGIDVDALVATATEFATAESAAIFYDLGVEQTPFSTLISYLIRVLLTLTNNVGRTGGNVFFETVGPAVLDQSRVREPERALASGIPAIRALGNFGMFSPTLVPEEVLFDHPERLRALIVEGCNPILSYSDAEPLARGARPSRSARRHRSGNDRDGTARGLRPACAGRVREVGDRQLPEGLPGSLRPAAPAGGPGVG